MIDWLACPAVEAVPGRRGGAPTVIRSRVTPEDLIENIDEGPEWLAQNFELRREAIEAVLAFYHRHQHELAHTP